MHIHSYQIHNVLNVYRKQLSQGNLKPLSDSVVKNQTAEERIDLSANGQRQSLFDKISSEIVERIARYGPDTDFEAALVERRDDFSQKDAQAVSKEITDAAAERDTTFTYTVINEHNQKITHRLPIQPFSLPNRDMESTSGALKDNDKNAESE